MTTNDDGGSVPICYCMELTTMCKLTLMHAFHDDLLERSVLLYRILRHESF